MAEKRKKTAVKAHTLDPDENPQFKALMERYERAARRKKDLEAEVKECASEAEVVKGLLKTAVLSLGLGQGTKLKVEGVGTFSFTSKKYHRLAKKDREVFCKMLADANEHALLTIGQRDLDAWCDDRRATDDSIPAYIEYFEDEFIPRVTLARQAPNE